MAVWEIPMSVLKTGDSNVDMFAQLDRIEEQNKEILAGIGKLLERKKPRKALIQEWIEPQGADPQLWKDYLAARKKKGAQMTPQAYKLILKASIQWKADGQDIDEILKKSISQGYTGLFPITKPKQFQDRQAPEVKSQSFKTFDPDAAPEIIDGVDPYADMKTLHRGDK